MDDSIYTYPDGTKLYRGTIGRFYENGAYTIEQREPDPLVELNDREAQDGEA